VISLESVYDETIKSLNFNKYTYGSVTDFNETAYICKILKNIWRVFFFIDKDPLWRKLPLKSKDRFNIYYGEINWKSILMVSITNMQSFIKKMSDTSVGLLVKISVYINFYKQLN